MFVSGLSVSEFVLLPGLTSLGVVSGSIVYSTQEIEMPESSKTMKAQASAQTRVLCAAYDRMRGQAERLGASGVIDVRVGKREVDRDLWEFTAQGTAVQHSGPKPGGAPFACTFKGQDYYALTHAGYYPVGVALGVCVYYQKFHQRVQQKIAGSGKGANKGQNSERSDFTRGLYTARRSAMTALEAEAAALGAVGVIGITVTAKRTLNQQSGTSQGMMIEFVALGTAIIRAATPGSVPGTVTIDYGLPLANK